MLTQGPDEYQRAGSCLKTEVSEQLPGLGGGAWVKLKNKTGRKNISRAPSVPPSTAPWGHPKDFFPRWFWNVHVVFIAYLFPIYINALLLCATSNDYRLEPSDQAEGQMKVLFEMQFPFLSPNSISTLDPLSAHTHPNPPRPKNSTGSKVARVFKLQNLQVMAERAVDSIEVLSLSLCPVTNQPWNLGQVSSSLTSQLPDLLGGKKSMEEFYL